MARALQLARRGLYTTAPNPRVGSVLVRGGAIIAQGWHERAGGPHAEVAALAEAGGAARGADCYVTLEPCAHFGRTPPCANALIDAGVTRVVAAMTDPDPRVSGRGLRLLAEAGVAAASGLMQADAAEINRGFVMRMSTGRPFMRCKLALSADGFTAVHGGSKWITGEAARADVQRLRAESCAVLTGIGTVLADDPQLNVRRTELSGRQPLRAVLDRRLRFPAAAAMLRLPGRTLIFTRNADPGRQAKLRAAGADIALLDASEHEFADAALKYLAEKEQVNEILVEAGRTLTDALLSLRRVDELIVYQSRRELGARGAAPFPMPGSAGHSRPAEWRLADRRAVGNDWRLTFRPLPDGV
ncbi:MAG: bifunctional diaminohydroxyphosphoribosylaminopyrimidine deaminase/5-amino-6-(5-phosphoribosylamino)uracil reductase RibD [Gammaproteobacteria bacterium]|nr:bifunctional diaminohydroxyphosphoribosylaminopyrimidine deaminase/5-amino-6-(5-phosphoribosylamino)uracil reductase RibD [Gammaproteobacteria bacterium]